MAALIDDVNGTKGLKRRITIRKSMMGRIEL